MTQVDQPITHPLLARAAEDAEARYRLLFDFSPDALFVIGPEGRILDANQTAVERYGYTRAELLALSVEDLAAPDLRSQAADWIAQACRERTRFEWRHRRKDGSVIPVEISTRPLRIGLLECFLSSARDLTERYQQEASLRRALRAFKVLAACNQALVRAQREEDLLNDICRLLVNEGGYRLAWIGFAEQDEQRSVRPAVHAGQDDGYVDSLQATWADEPHGQGPTGTSIRTGAPVIIHDLATHPAFQPWRAQVIARGFAACVSLPLTIDGIPVGALSIYAAEPDAFDDEEVRLLVDLASNVSYGLTTLRAREEILRLNADLERRVAERTAELQAKNRELETFTYSVSHDLKAPLRGIDGYSRLLAEEYADRLDDEGQAFIYTICRAAQQMNQLIDDLLAYSRFERRPLQPRALELIPLIESLLAERRDEIRTRAVEVRLDVGCATAVADAEGLSQALRNLIDNALKFTRDTPTPRLEIGSRATGGKCQLWVRDNGPGFDMRYHDRIFEIFQRLHRSEDYPGTGIGLAIVSKAMERMGGRAWAESIPGQGATFYLELPLEQ